MAPKRIWEDDLLARRIVALSERLLRLRALTSSFSKSDRERMEAALFHVEQEIDAIQPDDPEGKLLEELHSELGRRKVSVSQVARELDISRQSLHAIITGRSHLGPRMNDRLTGWITESRKHPSAGD